MKKNIILTGFMGTGKSAVGEKLADILEFNFIDTDDEIVKTEGMSIADIFKKIGECYFRDRESQIIKRISSECKNSIISTGGGAVLRKENINMLRTCGMIVNLSANSDTIIERIGDNSGRPLADGKTKQEIENLLLQRKEAYENCDLKICVDNKSVNEIAEEIIQGYEVQNDKD